jgi:hypothetical protein
MVDEPVAIVHSSGNVYRDFGSADVRHVMAILGAQIIKILDEEKLSNSRFTLCRLNAQRGGLQGAKSHFKAKAGLAGSAASPKSRQRALATPVP